MSPKDNQGILQENWVQVRWRGQDMQIKVTEKDRAWTSQEETALAVQGRNKRGSSVKGTERPREDF